MEINWLTPFERNDIKGDVSIGFDEHKKWWVRFRISDREEQPPERLDSDDSELMGMWPLMFDKEGFGGDYHFVKNAIKNRLHEAGHDIQIVESFPFLEIAQDAIRRHPGWAQGGLSWIADFELENVDVDLAYFMFTRSFDRKLPQNLRHKLQAGVHRWEKAHQCCFVRYKDGAQK